MVGGSMKEKIKIVAYFDYVDFDDDVNYMKDVINSLSNKIKDIEIVFCKNENEFDNNISSNCLAIIDYGALNFIGQSGMVDHLDRYIINKIENNPSITFIFLLTMGKGVYSDSIFEYANVKTIERCCDIEEWEKLF